VEANSSVHLYAKMTSNNKKFLGSASQATMSIFFLFTFIVTITMEASSKQLLNSAVPRPHTITLVVLGKSRKITMGASTTTMVTITRKNRTEKL